MKKLGHIKWDEGAGSTMNARRHLPGMVSAYFGMGREILSKDPKPADLHRLRLATKRLRYALDLFRACYGPGLRTRIWALRPLQQSLGEVNDCATAATVVAVSRGKSAQRTRVEKFLSQRAQAKTEEFRREWKQDFDAPGKERWWTTYLARHARVPSRKP